METVIKVVGASVLVILIVAVLAIVMAYPTMWLVNYTFSPTALMAVFGMSALNFWHALWLNVLCGLLFKSTSTSSTKN